MQPGRTPEKVRRSAAGDQRRNQLQVSTPAAVRLSVRRRRCSWAASATGGAVFESWPEDAETVLLEPKVCTYTVVLRDSGFADCPKYIGVAAADSFTPFPRTQRAGDAPTVVKLIMDRPRLFLRMVAGSERDLSVNAPLAFEPSVVVFRPPTPVAGVREVTAGSRDDIGDGRGSCKLRGSTYGSQRDRLLGNTTCILKRVGGPFV
ncbi:hypothetical protein MRX96_006720 [Rhipicephalus microplus]